MKIRRVNGVNRTKSRAQKEIDKHIEQSSLKTCSRNHKREGICGQRTGWKGNGKPGECLSQYHV
jgi:hypothetical protein